MILIVDDDPAITTLLKMSFELEGHVVVTASSGAEALELIRRLRSNEATADIPIVCCSARALSHDVQAGYEAGADDYITKPFEPFELIERVEQRVEGKVQLRVIES
jgi:CheY-like chemotaxis protein